MSYTIDYTIDTTDTVCSAINKIDNEIRNVIFPALNYLATRQAGDTPPPAPQFNEMWLDTNTNELKVYLGTWKLYNKTEIEGAGTTRIVNFSNAWNSTDLKQEISLEVEFQASSPTSWIDPLDPEDAPLRVRGASGGVTGIWKHGIYAHLTDFYIKPGDNRKIYIVGDETNDNVLHHLHQDGSIEPYALVSDVAAKQVYTRKTGEYNYIRIPKTNLPAGDKALFPMAHGFIEIENVSSGLKVIYGFYISNNAPSIQGFLLSPDTFKEDADYFYIRLPSFKRFRVGIPSPYQIIQLTKGADIVTSVSSTATTVSTEVIYSPPAWLYEVREYTLADGTLSGGYYYVDIPFQTEEISGIGIGAIFELTGWSVPGLEYLDRTGTWTAVSSAIGITDFLLNAYVDDGVIYFRFSDGARSSDYIRVEKYRLVTYAP